MGADDNENKSRLPPRVERALARAREAAKVDNARKDGRWLAIVPFAVGATLLLLIMPRATAPEAIPLPRTDSRVLRDVARTDDARAATAEGQRLPTDVLAIGTALRALNHAQKDTADELTLIDARRNLQSTLSDLKPRPGLEADILALRALQTRHFLDAIAHYEETGEKSADLDDLAGDFVERNAEAGWTSGRQLLMSEMQRRVAFKIVWNALVGVDVRPGFAPSLDEERELYTFYLEHPRVAESYRLAVDAQLHSAHTAEACASANAELERQKEIWRADKIKRLAAIDAAYPGSYALGVAYYRARRFDLSAEAFTAYVGDHPDGPYALRAKNHLKAALVASVAF